MNRSRPAPATGCDECSLVLLGAAPGCLVRWPVAVAVLSSALFWLGARVGCLAWPWFFARGAGSFVLCRYHACPRTLSWIRRKNALACGLQRRDAVGACNPRLEAAAFCAPPAFGTGYLAAGVFAMPLVCPWFLTLQCLRVHLHVPACAQVLWMACALVQVGLRLLLLLQGPP